MLTPGFAPRAGNFNMGQQAGLLNLTGQPYLLSSSKNSDCCYCSS